MALSYGEVHSFVKDNGNVAAYGERTKVTLLKDGSVDAVALIEKDATVFEYQGKPYSRAEFEKLVKSKQTI
jgi:hypothetical protein